jgi:hypothetical protein
MIIRSRYMARIGAPGPSLTGADGVLVWSPRRSMPACRARPDRRRATKARSTLSWRRDQGVRDDAPHCDTLRQGRTEAGTH